MILRDAEFAVMEMQPMMRDGGAPAMNKRLPMPAAAEGNLAPLPEVEEDQVAPIIEGNVD
jgi:hypothetical protein